MKKFLSCLPALLLAASLSANTNGPVAKNTPVIKSVADANNPVDRELRKLMEQDDEAQAEVDKWIRENNEFAAKGAGVPATELNRRILNRFEAVRRNYENFIQQHTNHVRARVAYASFLSDIRDEEGQFVQLEKARELDPTDPALWNNLANYHGRNGPVKKAFDYYAKAIELSPAEPLYYHNLGNAVFLFRTNAMDHYGINEQQVFDKALDLFGRALKLDPGNFPFATDVAKTYYGIKPARPDDGLRAWTNALSLAHDELEREGVYVHFARMKTQAGRFAEARAHLNTITNETYADLKEKLTRSLDEKEAEAKPPATPP